MFKWIHHFSVEVNIPVKKIWEFYVNPNNWHKWMDPLDSCSYEGELKKGSIVKGNVKNKNRHISIVVTEKQPLNYVELLIKVPFFTQVSGCTLEEISPKKTRINIKTSVTSLLTPFMKSYYTKQVETQLPKFIEVLKAENVF